MNVSAVNSNEPPDSARRSTLADWLGLIRFSHTVFALPFAILAALLAWSTPFGDPALGYPPVRWQHGVGIVLCMVFARSAAMAFNRLVDHQIDAANPRTAVRHLPAGVLSRRSVVWFTLLCATGFIASTLWFLPNRAPLLASVPVLAFLLGYSLAKRFTASAHVWLGVALALSPICVWVAIRGDAVWGTGFGWSLPLLLAGAVACWVAGFDILYACQDAGYDADVGLHSIPAKFGIVGALRIAAVFHAVMLVLLVMLVFCGHLAGLGLLFAFAVALTAILVIRQHRLVRPDDLTRVNEAFFHMNAVISVLLLVAGGLDCWV